MLMNTLPIRITVFFLWLRTVCPGGVQAAGPETIRHKVAAGDTIRGLILGANCISSMSDYSRAREAFAGLNPALAHSEMLQPGSVIAVPVLFKGKGCLAFREQRIVRVEFEGGGAMEKVLVYLDGPVLPEVFTLRQTRPVRVVCDFEGVLPEAGLQRDVDVPGRMIHRIRLGHEDKPFRRARVVLDVDDAVAGRIEQEFFEQHSLFVLTLHEAAKN
jgi:hypothetical protein